MRPGSVLKAAGIALGVANLALWFAAPALRRAAEFANPRLAAQGPLAHAYGVLELMVYFDPWLARYVFPAIYTLGFVAIPFLAFPRSDHTETHPRPLVGIVLGFFLSVFEAFWLYLLGVGVLMRDRNWVVVWPSYSLDVFWRGSFNLSQWFWDGLVGVSPRDVAPGPVSVLLLRESPGIAMVAAYFGSGLLIARYLYRSSAGATRLWNAIVLVLLLQLAALVPIKVLLLWWLGLKFWVFLPEYGVSV